MDKPYSIKKLFQEDYKKLSREILLHRNLSAAEARTLAEDMLYEEHGEELYQNDFYDMDDPCVQLAAELFEKVPYEITPTMHSVTERLLQTDDLKTFVLLHLDLLRTKCHVATGRWEDYLYLSFDAVVYDHEHHAYAKLNKYHKGNEILDKYICVSNENKEQIDKYVSELLEFCKEHSVQHIDINVPYSEEYEYDYANEGVTVYLDDAFYSAYKEDYETWKTRGNTTIQSDTKVNDRCEIYW